MRLVAVLACMALLASALPGHAAPARAAEYTLETSAVYDVRPADRQIEVTVDLAFTNTTPDPPGRFSVFSELKVAIHDEATGVAATDGEGALDVTVETEDDVNVATIELRDDLRHEDEVRLELTYTLGDSEDPQLRVRPSVVVFPAWGFGSAGEVIVTIPAGYELRVDGDPLTEEGDRLTSGAIDDPGSWLALVTAVRPAEYADFEATVPLDGGTADVLVRAFTDDEAWGTRTVALVQRALPLIEDELGLPYPRLGQLVITEAVTTDASGFAERSSGRSDIMVAFDQPPFTALHQVGHVWLSPELIEARWIREGLASHVASRIAERLEVEPPYDPAAEAGARSAAAFPLDAWPANAGPDDEMYGYAASWAFIEELEATAGAAALRTVLARVAASLGPYQSADIEPEPPAESAGAPAVALDTRAFLDHLETVSDADVAPLFEERVLTEADAALLEPRAAARAAFDELVAAAGSWGAPDPVRGAMASWSFEEARAQIDAAADWLQRRDGLLSEMQEAGLSAPDRLQQAYRAYGGGPEAADELEAEATVVREYAATAQEVSSERSLIARVGLIGGPDPQAELNMANGRFADGDLRGAFDALGEAQKILAAAETGGLVRLASVVLLLVILAVVAVVLLRRRSYTSPR